MTKDGKREPRSTSIDGEMCNILIAETNKLKGEVESFKQSLGWKENEVKLLKKKIRDTEYEMKDMQSEVKNHRSEEVRVAEFIKTGERANFTPTELTSKSTLRRFVDELNKECGEFVRGDCINVMHHCSLLHLATQFCR